MRYKYVALRKDIPIRGLELLQSLDRDLFHLLQTVIGNERLLKGINFRLHGIDTRQKMLLKLYEQILENIYRIKGDQTQAHHILSKIEDLLEEEGTQIISSSNNGILRIYFYDSKDNSFFIIAPSFDEEHVSELFLKSLGQILDRYIARTFKNLSPGQHDYIKKCIEFITNNYFNSGFIAGKAMREGWNSLIHALQHLNDHLGDKSLWDYINILQKRNILLVPFFKIAFDSPKGRSDLVKTIDAIVTAINIIPIEILQKSPEIPVLVSSVITSAGSVLGREADIVVINYDDVDPNNFQRNLKLMHFKATNILIHEIAGHYLFYLLIKQGKITALQLRQLLSASKTQTVEYIFDGRYKEAGIDEWFHDFEGDLNALIHSLIKFDSHKDTAKYLASFHERIAFACGDTERDIKLRYELTDPQIRDELSMHRDIIRILTSIGLLSFERNGRQYAFDPFDFSVTELP